MIFLCFYVGEWKGGALMHVYELEHIISLSYRTTWWMFTKLDRDEVLIIMHLFIGFSANSTGRGGGNLPKIGQWGIPSPKDFFFSLSYRTTWWMFTKLDRDEVLIITHLLIGFSANSTQGRIRGGGGRQFAKNRSMRGSFSKGLLLQIGMQQQQTECIPVSWNEILRLLLFWLISQIWQSCFLIC